MAFAGGSQTVAGPIEVQFNGRMLQIEGSHTVNFGFMKKEAVMGPNNEVHGLKRTPNLGKISGSLVLTKAMMPFITEIMDAEDAVVTLRLPNGSYAQLREAFQSGDGDMDTEAGTLSYEFTGRTEIL